MSTLALTLASTGLPGDLFGSPTAFAEDTHNQTAKLKFNSNGKFKIVQFNDPQDDERIDRRTIELMEKVLRLLKNRLCCHQWRHVAGGPAILHWN